MRLWKYTSQKGDKELNRRKVNQGVSDTAFRDFFVKDDKVYSVKPLITFEGKEIYQDIKEFVKKNLVDSNKYTEILVSCS